MGQKVGLIEYVLLIATSSNAVFDMYPNTGKPHDQVFVGFSRSVEGDL